MIIFKIVPESCTKRFLQKKKKKTDMVEYLVKQIFICFLIRKSHLNGANHSLFYCRCVVVLEHDL